MTDELMISDLIYKELIEEITPEESLSLIHI